MHLEHSTQIPQLVSIMLWKRYQLGSQKAAFTMYILLACRLGILCTSFIGLIF